MHSIRNLLSIGVVFLSCAGSAREKTAADDILVFKAKHYRTTGPCIKIGDDLEMPVIDAFEVVEVLNGSLPKSVKHIQVRALTGEVANVKEGDVYVLRLNPSVKTKSQIGERAKDRYSWLWVDADELKPEKQSSIAREKGKKTGKEKVSGTLINS